MLGENLKLWVPWLHEKEQLIWNYFFCFHKGEPHDKVDFANLWVGNCRSDPWQTPLQSLWGSPCPPTPAQGAQPCWCKGNVRCCIFKMQVRCLVVGVFHHSLLPLLRTKQGVLKMERRHRSLLFLLASLPACLTAELCCVLWISGRRGGTEDWVTSHGSLYEQEPVSATIE